MMWDTLWDKTPPLLAHWGDGPESWGYGGWHGAMMGLHGLFWLALLVLVIVAVAVAVRVLMRGSSAEGVAARRGAGPSDALAILELRYARGEIDREEFVTRKKDLTG